MEAQIIATSKDDVDVLKFKERLARIKEAHAKNQA
jgi:hypothetical protein